MTSWGENSWLRLCRTIVTGIDSSFGVSGSSPSELTSHPKLVLSSPGVILFGWWRVLISLGNFVVRGIIPPDQHLGVWGSLAVSAALNHSAEGSSDPNTGRLCHGSDIQPPSRSRDELRCFWILVQTCLSCPARPAFEPRGVPVLNMALLVSRFNNMLWAGLSPSTGIL